MTPGQTRVLVLLLVLVAVEIVFHPTLKATLLNIPQVQPKQ